MEAPCTEERVINTREREHSLTCWTNAVYKATGPYFCECVQTVKNWDCSCHVIHRTTKVTVHGHVIFQ